MRDQLETGLANTLTDSRFNSHRKKHLPNTCILSFYGLEANRILEEIERGVKEVIVEIKRLQGRQVTSCQTLCL